MAAGCAVRAPDKRPQISEDIQQRTGHAVRPEAAPAGWQAPQGISLEDGLTEDEAVALALWNNAVFHADLAELGFARAELLEAGLLRNPVFTLLFPLGPKQLETYATFPLEALWQRPRRVAAAKLNHERAAQSLTAHGLDLVRDVRLAFAELALAGERHRLAREAVRLRGQIQELVEARLRAGDVSELEAGSAGIDRKIAEEQAARSAHEVGIARTRLRSLVGLRGDEHPFEIVAGRIGPSPPGELPKLLERALASRPDLRAAELAVEAAQAGARLERRNYGSLAVVPDANSRGKEGFEIGPGVQAELPIVKRNQGAIAKADAAVERAARQQAAAEQKVTLEVREAHARALQTGEALDAWHNRILPPLEEAAQLAARAYQAGEVSYLFVLETSRRLLDARLSAVEAEAQLRRARAELDRSVGTRLVTNP